MIKVPASYPIITKKDKEALHKAVDKGWFTEGTNCRNFERALNKFTQNKYCQLVNSGSSANFVAITSAKEYFDGDLIVTSALAFPTTVAPIYQNNKIPVFVDTDLETLSPDIGQIAYLLDKYGDKIGGGIFTHMLGFPYDERIVRTLLGFDRFLIADCCDAMGAKTNEMPVGSWSDFSTYSFFPAHHITTGEGGAVLSRSDELFKIVRSLVNWGRDCYCLPGQQNVCGKRFEQDFLTLPEGYDHKYTFTRLGYNLKMTELQATMGVTQMSYIDLWVSQRKLNFYKIMMELKKFNEYIHIMKIPEHSEPSPFGIPIIMKITGYTDDLINHLETNGISTRRIFAGNITRQPGYYGLPYLKLDLDNTNHLMENSFWIGCGPWMTTDQRNWIVNTIEEWFDEKGFL